MSKKQNACSVLQNCVCASAPVLKNAPTPGKTAALLHFSQFLVDSVSVLQMVRVTTNMSVSSVMNVQVAIPFEFICAFQFGPYAVRRKFVGVLICLFFFFSSDSARFYTEKPHRQMQWVFV